MIEEEDNGKKRKKERKKKNSFMMKKISLNYNSIRKKRIKNRLLNLAKIYISNQ